jgi:hypothetical protein
VLGSEVAGGVDHSPPLHTIGHYEIIDGELHRYPGRADEGSPPSPKLLRALEP